MLKKNKRTKLNREQTYEFVRKLPTDFYFGIEEQKEEIKYNNRFWNRVYGNYKHLTPVSPNWRKIIDYHPKLIFTI